MLPRRRNSLIRASSSRSSNLSAIVVFLAKNYRSRASVDGAQDTSLSADGLPARTGDIVCRRSETCLPRGFRGGDLLGGGFGAPGRIGENPALSLGLVLMEARKTDLRGKRLPVR